MSDTPNIDELRDAAKILVALLDDPQPGLMTWSVALHAILKQIAEFGPGATREPVLPFVQVPPPEMLGS